MSYSKKYLEWHINNKASVNDLFVEADAEIKKLESENKELREGQEWISVEDFCFILNKEYLFYLTSDETQVMRYKGKRGARHICHDDIITCYPTHVQPLPKPPKEQKQS
jgi:hypothetical protein